MSKRLLKLMASMLLTLSMLLPMPAQAASPQELRPVVLQLRWDHQFQFAGYYAAQWLGYYAEEGLEVEIRSAFRDQQVVSATEEVTQGRAQFGVGAADILIAEDRGARLTLVSSFFQRSAVEYYALENTPIATVYELSQRNIARRKEDLLDIELQALFLNEGIHPYSARYTDVLGDFTVDDLTSGRYEVVPSYLGKLPYQASLRGISLKAFKPVDYGIDFYGDTLFTSEQLAKTDPQLVERFRKATLKGWSYALRHPEEIADKIAYQSYISTQGAASLEDLTAFNRDQAVRVLELTHFPIVEIGNINPDRWARMSDTLMELGILSTALDIDAMIFDYGTIRYDQLERTGRVLLVLAVSLLVLTTLLFIHSLKRKNRHLEVEVATREEAERQLLRSNQRYETIYNSSVIGITMTDSQGRILHFNEAWCRMTGYSPEELTGMNIQDLIHPDSREVDRELALKLQSGELTNYTAEKRYLRKPPLPGGPQDTFWGKLFITRIYDSKTEERVNMAMVMDITQEVLLETLFQKELDENRRKEALILYQARMAAMGEMIGNIAHQWRQPLNTLSILVSNLQEELRQPDGDKEYIDSACDKARDLIWKMSETIDDFRDFSKPNAAPGPFRVSELLQSVLSLMEELHRTARIQVLTAVREEPPLQGPANQFSHVLFNLLANASDALKDWTPKDGAPRCIQVDIEASEGVLTVRIQDNGPGIPEALRDRIFEMYFSTHEATGGSGLGLYMARTIVENTFGGTLCLTDSLEGAAFRIDIPLTPGGAAS